MNRRKKILLIAAAALVFLAIIALSINVNRSEPVPVQTERVEQKRVLVSKVSAAGEIRPKEYVELQAEIAGVIRDLYVKEGDQVREGDLLLRIDPAQTAAEAHAQQAALEAVWMEAHNQKAQISLQEAQLRRDHANLRLTEIELTRTNRSLEIARPAFKRKRQLYEDNLISKDLYEAAKKDLINTEAAVPSARARLDQAKTQLAVSEVLLEQAKNSYQSALSRVEQNRALLARKQDLLTKTMIRSPLAGVITQLQVQIGERAVPGTLNNPAATLMVVADLSVVEAEVGVDETDIVDVRPGQEAEIRVDALPDTPLKGQVTEIGNSAIQRLDQARRQQAKDFRVVIELASPPERLRPGLSCLVQISTAQRENVLTVPIQALTLREFPVDGQGKLIKPHSERYRREKADPKKTQ